MNPITVWDATVSEDGIAFGSGYSHHGIEWGNPDAWEFDATYHWTVCPGCGETVYHSEHMASCMDDQNTCESCGDTAKEDGITIKTGHYYVNWDEFCSDKDNHWYVCKYCDEHVDEMPHVGSCQDATGNSVKSNTVTLNAKAETSGKDAALVITAGDVNGDGAANEQDVSLLMSLCCENE